ncbi:MAG: hypothetical protein HWN66_06155 [Candidatus Helarchaeota archaeon]|nr:hypothetical protein [Candidatus Helarchaeota archaeon]
MKVDSRELLEFIQKIWKNWQETPRGGNCRGCKGSFHEKVAPVYSIIFQEDMDWSRFLETYSGVMVLLHDGGMFADFVYKKNPNLNYESHEKYVGYLAKHIFSNLGSKFQKTSVNPTFQKLRAWLNELTTIDPNTVYYTNTIKCKHRENSLKQCRPYLFRELDIMRPQIILCFHETAFKSLYRYAREKKFAIHFVDYGMRPEIDISQLLSVDRDSDVHGNIIKMKKDERVQYGIILFHPVYGPVNFKEHIIKENRNTPYKSYKEAFQMTIQKVLGYIH